MLAVFVEEVDARKQRQGQGDAGRQVFSFTLTHKLHLM